MWTGCGCRELSLDQFEWDPGIGLWDLLLGGASDVRAATLTMTFRAEIFQSWLVTESFGLDRFPVP